MFDGYWFGAGGLFMLLFMLVFWIFVVAAAAWVALSLARPQRRGDGSSSAVRILEERLARGDIDAMEFRERCAAIEGRS